MPTAPCTPEDCVERPAAAVGPLRRAVRIAAFAGSLVGGLALVPVGRWIPARLRDRLIRSWCRLLLGSLGVRVRTGGAVDRGPGLLVANHISWLDILLIAAVAPGRMLAKTEVGHWPVLGPLIGRGGTLFIDRERLRSLPGTVAEIAAALRRGERVVVFPEGSTWCGRAGGRFRPALFQAAIDADAPVRPMTLRYRLADGGPTTTPAFVGDDALGPSIWRVLALRGLVAEAVFEQPLPAGAWQGGFRAQGRRELARAAQAVVDRHRDGVVRPADRDSGTYAGNSAGNTAENSEGKRLEPIACHS
ncbi:lysophospholipid acyltransferase family protein [Kitasatospora sp. NPDC006697]|uniref:lysophospholipid acyltransferase family protein n=1 Tax=Kitasatospora sp. NPDC006697 TaxID=3364020 RepID=UPI0036A34CBD